MSHLEDRPLTTQEETMEILISLVRGKSSTNPNYFRMKKQVSCSIQRNEILFTGMLRKLESLSKHRSTEELCNDLKEIFNNLIENEQISWGKIIAIFSFSVFIAEKHLEMRDRIVRFSGDYLVEKSTRWIDAQGGWVRRKIRCSRKSIFNFDFSFFRKLSL